MNKMPPSDSSAKHRRSRTGCLTCRRRKKRCDELKPCCKTCQRLALKCVYPDINESDRKTRKRNQIQSERSSLQASLSESKANMGDGTSEVDFSKARPAKNPPANNVFNVSEPPITTSYMPQIDQLPAAPLEIPFDNVDVMDRSQFAFTSTNEATISPPSSMEQSTDCFRGISGPFPNLGRETRIPLSPTLSLLSPISPVTSLGNTNVNSRLDPLFSMGNRVALDDLRSPTSEEFHNAYPDLDDTAINLLEYFHSQQSKIRSVSPLKCFRSVALLFSLRSRTNLFGLLSWTAWHRGSKNVAQKYFHLASEQLEQNAPISKEELLAALLVLTSAKISSGHSESWPLYLVWASSLLKRHGGVSSFMETEISRWLLLQFAYLDILSINSSSTPKLLSASDLEFIFRRSPSSRLSESLCSCCEPLLLKIEHVNELSKLMRVAHSTGENLEELYNAAHVIEEQTWALQPVVDKISHLSAVEQQLQLCQFGAFKLVTVLHLYQSALCMNAAATPILVLARRLLRAIDELIDSNVAGMLVFPLFILGVNSSNATMRQQLLQHFDRLLLRIHTRSVERVKNLLLRVWRLDQSGTRHIDWTELVDQGFDFRCG